MNLFWMLLAFLIMSGAALLYCGLLKVNTGEGMLLSASGIIGILFLSGALAGTFTAGMYVIYALSLAGYLYYGAGCIRKQRQAVFRHSPYFLALLFLFVFSVVIYRRTFIQHVDEFHQWAMTVKYMLESDSLPWTTDLVSHSHPFGTGLFHLFFQKLTGYSEPNMYSSAFLLMWTGFLLPFSGYEKRDWKKVTCYVAILYLGLYSLYYYGAKNLYVDLPVIGWCGGLAGWWMNRSKKKTDLLVAAAGLVSVCFFKMLAGPLLAVFVLLFMAAQTFLVEKGILDDRERRKKILKIVLAVLVIGIVLFAAAAVWAIKADIRGILPDFLQKQFEENEVTNKKAILTCDAFLTTMTGTAVSGRSGLKVAFVPFMLMMAVLAKILADIYRQKKRQIVYTVYMAVSAVIFCGVLLAAFVLFFSYEESIAVTGLVRYLSLEMLYVFVILLTWLFQRKTAYRPKVREYTALGMAAVLLYGVNGCFIPDMTGVNQQKISKYEDIVNVRKQAQKIEKLTDENDHVYFLNQESAENYSAADYAGSEALYYLEERVSNYQSVPWKFTENGSRIRVADFETPAIEDFRAILAGGEYTYVWIYKTDSYLNEQLKELLDCEEIRSGCLYRVDYEGDVPVKLTLETKLG